MGKMPQSNGKEGSCYLSFLLRDHSDNGHAYGIL